jgi:hypothetical protein
VKRTLQILALVLPLLASLYWLGAGAHRGWTQTSVAVKSVDEVTGIEGIRYEPRFVPGLDFLAGGLLGAVLLAGSSFCFSKRKTKTQVPDL